MADDSSNEKPWGGRFHAPTDRFVEEFTASVGKVRLNATMTQNVVMYTVEVNTENTQGTLMPYLTANVHFIVGRASSALLVPNAALRWSPMSLAQVAPDARAERPINPPPGESGGASRRPEKRDGDQERSGTIWLKDGSYVRPVTVKLGISDGTNTVVLDDSLREGQEVVIGEIAESAQTGARSPFVPQIIRR